MANNKFGRLVYEWVTFSWKTGISMGLLSNSVAAHPYQNQTWAPRGWHTRIWVWRACLSLETRNHCEGSFSHRKRCPFWPFLEIVLEKYNLFSLNLECNSRVCNGPICFILKIWPMFTWAGMWLCNLAPMHPGGGTPIETLYGVVPPKWVGFWQKIPKHGSHFWPQNP